MDWALGAIACSCSVLRPHAPAFARLCLSEVSSSPCLQIDQATSYPNDRHAAGDCSWLGDELTDLQTRLADGGITLRMVCEKTGNPLYLNSVATLAESQPTDVRRYGEESRLRCIIIDRDNKSHREMLLLERATTANEILSLIPTPTPLRRDHTARVIEPDSPLFDAICLAYDYLFEKAKPLTGA